VKRAKKAPEEKRVVVREKNPGKHRSKSKTRKKE